jgi:hypothetical protein
MLKLSHAAYSAPKLPSEAGYSLIVLLWVLEFKTKHIASWNSAETFQQTGATLDWLCASCLLHLPFGRCWVVGTSEFSPLRFWLVLTPPVALLLTLVFDLLWLETSLQLQCFLQIKVCCNCNLWGPYFNCKSQRINWTRALCHCHPRPVPGSTVTRARWQQFLPIMGEDGQRRAEG